MIVRGLFLTVALTACTGGHAAVLANGGNANRGLTGIWDVSMSLDRPYPLEVTDPPARRVCGTIGFVDGNRQFDGTRDESAGVYDIDLARIGLDWTKDTGFPAAIGRLSDTRLASPDSVAITLNPDSQERIQLTGLYRIGEIDGGWTAQSRRGTANGVFTLRPHSSDSRQSC